MKFIISFLLPFIAVSLYAQIITTSAGNGTYGYSGNGGPATSAQLAWPFGIATDNGGNLYICDHDNNMIRKVDAATGIISTIAGTGTLGYSGDGGPATAAHLYHPGTITIDNANNIFFTDQNGDVIRKIGPSGIISSITGNLPLGYSGDGGPLILAQFYGISGLTVDNLGNLYIADGGNNVIRKVNAANIITTIAGNGTQGFSGDGGAATAAQLSAPYAVVVRPGGIILIPDPGNHRIRSVNTSGIITTFAGNGVSGYTGDGGPATAAALGWPWHSTIDPSGNIYIADGFHDVVRKIDNSGIITTFAGNGTSGYSGDGGPAILAQMTDVCGVASDNGGNIFIVNRTFPNVVRKVTNCLVSTITVQPSDVTLCNFGNVTFTIAASNANTYQWQENTGAGWNNLADNATYSGCLTPTLTITGVTTAMNSYQYRCVVGNSCGNNWSMTALLTVITPSAPTINISTTSSTVCAGINTQFTAAISNGGTSPVYQWKKNGTPVGTNSNTYSDNALVNGDLISCQLTSNSTCTSSPTATSNNITMTVNPLLTPSVSITASQNNFCYGTMVSFNSLSTNPGLTPSYQWKKNGTNVGTNSPLYNDNTLMNGDIISCILTSSEACLTTNTVVSNNIQMNVTPLVTASITVFASRTSICKGDAVTFNAGYMNGGTNPIFQWQKNGINTGNNSAIYTDNSLQLGDAIKCILTSNASCLSAPNASSNTVIISVNPDPVVSLDKGSSICTGSTKVLDAGNFATYQWNDGSTLRTLSINMPGKYYVTVTNNNGCKGSDTSELISLLPLPGNFLPADSAICSYEKITIQSMNSYSTYLWNNGYMGNNLTINTPGTYWLEVTAQNGCKGRDSIRVLPKPCFRGLFVPNSFTPNNDSRNDIFRPVVYGTLKQFEFRVLNRYGQTVFYSKDNTTGWDGKYKGSIQNTGAFTWICTYQIDNQMLTTEQGSVLLIR